MYMKFAALATVAAVWTTTAPVPANGAQMEGSAASAGPAKQGSEETMGDVDISSSRQRAPDIIVNGRRVNADILPTYRGGQVGTGARNGVLGNIENGKSPFSTSSYSEQFMLDRQADTASEALALEPSVRATQGTGAPFDSFYIRGYPINEGTSGEIAFDGTYGVAPSFRIFTDYAERVEVLKGPSAALTGMSPNGGIGGTINIVPKRANADLTRFTFDFGSTLRPGAQADISRRIGAGDAWGARAIAAVRDGDTPYDDQSERTVLGAFALDYHGHRVRAWLNLVAQTDRFDAPLRPYFASAGVKIPDAPDGSTNPTQRWEYSNVDDFGGLLRMEYDATDHITLFGTVGARRSDVDRYFASSRVIQNDRGDTTTSPQLYQMRIEAYTFEAGVRARFATGPISHSLVAQGSYYDEDTTRYLSPVTTTYRSNIYAPSRAHYSAPAESGDRPKLSDSTLKGVSVADTLSALDEKVLLTIGARRQTIRAHNYTSNVGTLSGSYDRSVTTPFIGLVLRPVKWVSFYGNHVEGLSRGDTAPAQASNSGEILAPYVARQIEAGMKLDFGSIGGSISAFRITRQLGELGRTNVYAQTGEQRIRGLEFTAYGRATARFGILGGLTLLDGELIRTEVLANKGNTPIGVPKIQLNVGADWDIPFATGLNVSAAVVRTGRQFVDAANRQALPAWTRLDLGLRQTVDITGRQLTIRGAVSNVTNQKYWSGVASFGTFFQGAPRTFSLSASIEM